MTRKHGAPSGKVQERLARDDCAHQAWWNLKEREVGAPPRVRSCSQTLRRDEFAFDAQRRTIRQHEADLFPTFDLRSIPHMVGGQNVVSARQFDQRAGASEVYRVFRIISGAYEERDEIVLNLKANIFKDRLRYVIYRNVRAQVIFSAPSVPRKVLTRCLRCQSSCTTRLASI